MDSDQDGKLSRTARDQFEATVQNRANFAPADLARLNDTARSTTAYEALFQAMQMVFPQNTTAATSSQRYTDLLKSLSKAT